MWIYQKMKSKVFIHNDDMKCFQSNGCTRDMKNGSDGLY